ncbi:MAG: hypothetical protein WC346_05010 [Methanogenium sp.]
MSTTITIEFQVAVEIYKFQLKNKYPTYADLTYAMKDILDKVKLATILTCLFDWQIIEIAAVPINSCAQMKISEAAIPMIKKMYSEK